MDREQKIPYNELSIKDRERYDLQRKALKQQQLSNRIKYCMCDEQHADLCKLEKINKALE